MKSLIIIIISILLSGCKSNPVSSDNQIDFGIYLTKTNDINFPDSVLLKELILEKQPILTSKSISSYSWENHQIELLKNSVEEINAKGNLLGRYFVVIAENERVYWGKFMSNAMSSTCQNPVIRLNPYHPEKESYLTKKFIIDRAYPDYFGNIDNVDLRNDVRIYRALKMHNKLK